MMNVVMTDAQYESVEIIRKKIEDAGASFKLCNCQSEEEIMRETENADVVLCHFDQITRRVIKNLKKCKAIIRGAVGVDNIDVKAATDCRIPVVNVPDYGRADIADHVLMFALAASKKVFILDEEVKKGQWTYYSAKPVHRFSSKTVGLLGFGGISQLVAKRLPAFGCKVLAYDAFLDVDSVGIDGVTKATYDEVLRESDIISIHVPLNNETRKMINKDAFSKMKDGVILINTARGGIIDEGDLCDALSSGKVSAACLDVLETESADVNNPLFKFDNVIVTPHSAWYSEESVDILLNSIGDEAVRALRGEAHRHVVNGIR